MTDSVELPPSIELVLREIDIGYASPYEFVDSLIKTGLAKDLYQQADFTRTRWQYADQKDQRRGVFKLCPGGTVNPFDKWGKCIDPACSDAYARRFARTVGLYAEQIVVADPLTPMILNFEEEVLAPAAGPMMLFSTSIKLKRLEPLLRAGVILFGSAPALCSTCYENTERFVAERTERALTYLMRQDFRFRVNVADVDEPWVGLSFEKGDLVYSRPVAPPIASRLRKTTIAVIPSRYERIVLRPVIRKIAEWLERTVLGSYITSVRTRGIFAAGDRATATLFLDAQDPASKPTYENLEGLQSLDLPFVSELSVAETLLLRQVAQKSLPAFRSKIQSSLAESLDSTRLHERVAELRLQAAEVRSELEAIQKVQRWRNGLVAASAGLSMAIAATSPSGYGAVALGGALAAISLMHPHTARDKGEIAKLEASPAYVLIKAQDLLRHADSARGIEA